MLKEYVLNINEISNEDISFIKENYPKRFEQSLRFKMKDDFLRSIASYVLLVRAIGKFNEDDITYDNYKPSISSKPFFSYSHSKDLVYLVVSNKPVGADCEYIDAKNMVLEKAIVNEKEVAYLNEDKLAHLHILWTRKEAALKMLALGMQKEMMKQMSSNDKEIYVNGKTYLCSSYEKEGYAFSYVLDK